MEMRFEVTNGTFIIASKDDVIHINEKAGVAISNSFIE